MKTKLGSLIIILVIIDQLIKFTVVKFLSEPLVLIENFFSLTYIKNYGISFSMLDGSRYIILAVSIIAIGLIIYIMNKMSSEKKYMIVLSVMLAGAIGNFIDRLLLGYVIDYLDFIIFGYDFAIFNFADMLLVCGAIILIIIMYLDERKKNE